MKKWLFSFAVLLALCSCSANPQPSHSQSAISEQGSQASQLYAKSLSLYPAALNIMPGKELILKASPLPQNASVTWASDNTKIADIDQTGKLTAKAFGECVISITSGDKSAVCKVSVKDNCQTVIFASKPVKSEGKTPAQPTKEAKAEIPIVLPPEISDVNKLPKTDEFLWCLEFDDSFSTLVNNGEIPLIVNVSISFKAEKQGGKTAFGSYNGFFSGDADLDKVHFIKTMNEQPDIKSSGGKLTDYTETDDGIVKSPITVEIIPMDDAAYNEANIGYVPKSERSVTEQLPIPISSIFPNSMMATGDISGITAISGTMTMNVMGQSVTAPFGNSKNESQPYTICIYPSGDAVLTFPFMQRDGFERNWVEGILTKRPLS